MAPHGCYPCRGEDSWISIAVANDEEWRALCGAMAKPELAQDERFARAESRFEHQEELDRIIADWTRSHGRYELMHTLQKAGVAAAPSLSNEGLFQDPHLRERGTFVHVDHPYLKKDWVLAPPWRLSETPAAIHRHAPSLGEHSDQIFEQLLEMSPGEIEKLKEEEVIY
jgi:crotonobetainyl-CoA:carnitine CoA-transferase CaiB-like acyl-CoA transferase